MFSAGTGTGVAFSPSNNAIAVSGSVTPFIMAYPWSTAGFGTKFADPGTLPPNGTTYVTFDSTGSAIAVSHNTNPEVAVYPWSSSGFGTKYTNPVATIPGTGTTVAFN